MPQLEPPTHRHTLLLLPLLLPPLIRPDSLHCLIIYCKYDTPTHHLRVPVCTSQPNYIIIPCLIVPVQLRRGRTFVWPVECGALGIFQRKGSFLEVTAKGEEKRVRSRLLVPTLFFFSLSFSSVSITLFFLRLSGLSLGLYISLWISHFGTIPSPLCVCQSHPVTSPLPPHLLLTNRSLRT